MRPQRPEQFVGRPGHRQRLAGRADHRGNFGSLKNVCHGGSASGATDLGVTSTQIKVGVLTDEGFTKDPELVNAANVFSSWCNAAGGIDGRKIVPDIRDTQLLQVAQTVMTQNQNSGL